MRALKIIVVALGILIVAAFSALIYGIVQGWGRLGAPDRPAASAPSVPLAGVMRAPWGTRGLGLPSGARIERMETANGLVVLHVRDASNGEERLLVVDPATGAVVGTFAPTGAR